MKIGAMAESFRTNFRDAVRTAASLGAQGIQAYANGETIHAGMNAREIREAREIVRGEGLSFSALCGDFGCDMYYTENRGEIDREKKVMEIALELGTPIVTTHIGVVPEEPCAQYDSMLRVYRELAEFAASAGGFFAVETGPESAETLRGFLDASGSRGAAVNFDPANLVMCAGVDPVKAVGTLKGYIVHTHAKDGVQKRKIDTRALYAPKYYGLEPAGWDAIEETPLGAGGVDWDAYIAALKAIGFDGYLTIERECGDQPQKDIAAAVAFLQKYL